MYNRTYGYFDQNEAELRRKEQEINRLSDELYDAKRDIKDLESKLAAVERDLETEEKEKYRYKYALSDAEDALYTSNNLLVLRNADVEVLEEELASYRIIEEKTGMGPEDIINMVSTLQGTINAIKGTQNE